MKYPNWYNPNGGPVLTIHDFNTGIIYNISSGKSGAVCKTSFETLKNDRWFAVDSGHHHIRMKTTQELFNVPQRNGSSPLIYKGTASVRGINADIWVGRATRMNRKTNKSYEVKYSRSNCLIISLFCPSACPPLFPLVHYFLCPSIHSSIHLF